VSKDKKMVGVYDCFAKGNGGIGELYALYTEECVNSYIDRAYKIAEEHGEEMVLPSDEVIKKSFSYARDRMMVDARHDERYTFWIDQGSDFCAV
jgi:3-phosphoglycerate kinase